MIKCIDLQFFKGVTEVKEVDKREPKSDQLKAMDDAVYGLMGGLMQRYGGVSMPSIRSYTGSGSSGSSGSAGSYGRPGPGEGWAPGRAGNRTYDGQRVRYDEYGRPYTASYYTGGERQGEERSRKYITGSVPSGASDYTATAGGKLGGSGGGTYAAGYDDSGWGANGYLTKAFDTADDQAALTNANINELLLSTPEYLRKHQNFLDNGTDEGFEKYIAESERALANTYSKNVGTDLSNLAAKGILNSSVTNRALANQQAEIGDAVAKNRNTASNNWMNQYLQGYTTGMEGLKTNAELIPQYYNNAMSPMTPAYDFWNQSTQNWLANDKDYIATSSGK